MKEKNFILVVFGQIISLFGNAVLRFALPQHLLNVSGSPALFGMVSALAFLPLLIMSPIGGVVADRVNKRNIMVGLDFFTAALLFGFLAFFSQINLAAGVAVMLFLLYGISGAYQPAVQSSLPSLVPMEKLVSANAVINTISSLSGFLGPVMGGILYSVFGIKSVLLVSAFCFLASAVMEIFIKMPFTKQAGEGNFLKILWGDLKKSLTFISRERPMVGKVTCCIAAFNLFLSSLLIVGIPVVVTQVIPFEKAEPVQMVGYIQGIMAVGGLLGGVFCGMAGQKLKTRNSWKLLMGAGILLLPMAGVLWFGKGPGIQYGVMSLCSFLIMALATMFTVQMMAYIQKSTPKELIGKVIAWILAIGTCSQPLGQTLYGICFEKAAGAEGILFGAGALISMGISLVFCRIAREM